MKSVFVILGTRPEAIKLAPVIRELRGRADKFRCIVCSSGQHRELADQALASFGLKADICLSVMRPNQKLSSLTGRLFLALGELLSRRKPDWVLVQGDTTTALVGAMSAFYQGIKVGHVEAGLRSGERRTPFPEEINRRFISQLADLHFAPTPRAAEQLEAEGISPTAIHLTGNTVVDALHWVTRRLRGGPPSEVPLGVIRAIRGRRAILVTTHRRESFGDGLKSICLALRETVRRYSDVVVVFPVHPNPRVRRTVHRLLDSEPRVILTDPLAYLALLYVMRRSYCVLTDSGGLQEEAPSFGKPLLILRERTERPEVVEAGCARLVGTTLEQVIAGAKALLEDRAVYHQMAGTKNPFGDGKAAKRIATILERE